MLSEVWIVSIETINKLGKKETLVFTEYGTIYNCTRIAHTFVPKRGHKLLRIEFERSEVLC